MATSETKEIKKQETLVRFIIISYKTRLRVYFWYIFVNSMIAEIIVTQKTLYKISDIP